MADDLNITPRKSPFRVPDFSFKFAPINHREGSRDANRVQDSSKSLDIINITAEDGGGGEKLLNPQIPTSNNHSNQPEPEVFVNYLNIPVEAKNANRPPVTDLDMDESGEDEDLSRNLDETAELHVFHDDVIDGMFNDDVGGCESGELDAMDDIILAAGQPLAQSEADFFNLYPKMTDSAKANTPTRPGRKGDYSCGIGPFHPRCLQRFANIKVFALHYALAVLTILMFHTSFIGSVTGIEKRFRFPSQKSGFLMSINDIGHVPFVIIASFYLGQSRKPLFLGLGTVLFSLGVAFMTLPYFIFGPGQPTISADSIRSSVNGSVQAVSSLCRFSEGESDHKTTCSPVDFNRVSYVLMCVGEIILGIGGSWIGPLGMAYIDDNVEKAKSVPLYMAAVSCVRSLGPVFGFLLSALCSSIHETLKNPGLDKRDPRWIGAWWLGFCIIIILQVVVGLPLTLYPKKMRPKNERAKDSDCQEKMLKDYKDHDRPLARNDEIPKKITNIIGAVNSLVRNPVYIITTIGECVSIYSIVGYIIFLPKFMESQFSISASYANAITGSLGVFSSSAGIMIGGYIMKKLNIKLRGALMIAIAGLIITAIKAVLLMNLRCEPTNLAGYQTPIGVWNVSQMCNRNCQCDLNYFEPVCGNGNQRLYLNPCLAGCRNYLTNHDKKVIAYTHCSCVGWNLDYNYSLAGPVDLSAHPKSAVPGLCQRKCRNFVPYLIIMALGSFLAAPAVVAITMVKLRCVSVEEKPFALGFSSFLMSIIAFLPGPLITGTLIDKTCLIWKQGSCDSSGSCLFYDTDKLRYVIHGILTLSKVVATFLYIIAWWYSKDHKYVELEKIHYRQ